MAVACDRSVSAAELLGQETQCRHRNRIARHVRLVATLFESARNIGIARRRWLVAAAVITIGFAAELWQVRVFSSVMPIAMVPLVVAVAAIARRFTKSFGAVTRGLFACVLCLAVSPVGLAAASPAQESVAETIEPQKGEASCLKPDALGPLAQLPPTRVAASFDIGPYLLAYTRHSAFAGPLPSRQSRQPRRCGRLPRDAGQSRAYFTRGGRESSFVSSRAHQLHQTRAKRPWRGSLAGRNSSVAVAAAAIEQQLLVLPYGVRCIARPAFRHISAQRLRAAPNEGHLRI